MKKRNTFNQTLKLFLSLTLLAYLSPIEARPQGTVTFSKPRNAMYYEHDGSNWIHLINIENTYNAAGSRLTHIRKDAVTGQNLIKYENSYDVQERDTMAISFAWQSNTWVVTNGSKTLYKYNSANQITQLIFRFLQNGIWSNSTKTDYTYNPDGSLAEEITYQKDGNNGWSATNKRRTVYSYANGAKTEYITYYFQNSTSNWVPSQKRTFAGWHSPTLPMAYVDQMTNSAGVWEDQYRCNFTPLANGGYSQIVEQFSNGAWVASGRTKQEFNTQKHLTKLKNEHYNNGTWVVLADTDILWTYSNQNDILEKITIYPDSIGQPKRLQTKETYSNFQYFTRISGTGETQTTSNIVVFPNPATDKIHFESGEQKPQAITATISDLTGKIWKTQSFNATEIKQLNIEFLPNGIYLLTLQTEKGKTVQKIVKN